MLAVYILNPRWVDFLNHETVPDDIDAVIEMSNAVVVANIGPIHVAIEALSHKILGVLATPQLQHAADQSNLLNSAIDGKPIEKLYNGLCHQEWEVSC